MHRFVEGRGARVGAFLCGCLGERKLVVGLILTAALADVYSLSFFTRDLI